AMTLSEQLAGTSQLLAATQEALAETKTLAMVGEMAAGAAHELNNPLAVISGRAQLMAERAGSEEDRKTWRLIADQAQCISDIVSELMEFASPPAPAPSAVEPRGLFAEALEEFSSSDHPKAGLLQTDITIGSNTPPAWADRRQLLAVIVELITNAATATKAAPRVRLKAEAADIDESVLLTVADDGAGMDQQTLVRAFTPFYSSQQAGRRRGLGLPLAKRYVENNGGRIWISSKKDKGTTVCIELPPARPGR
ncbi:MAG: HAMP domain-containing histidine kinase, partial [Phycisphaerae bacterium]|nr:HAMP domain-containing histidine kinase [Phycisphaerae bacterium]